MNESPGTIELLSIRVDELEKRVRALEHPSEATTATPAAEETSVQASSAHSALETGKVFPIIGRAMLGIAGAYVLRAIAEAGVLPKLMVPAFAVSYAFGWLVWSTRTSNSLARAVYAATSALLLASILWENTLAFHVFAPVVSAGLLAAFLTLAAVLGMRDGMVQSMSIALSIAALITASMAFATHQVLPFVIALLIAVCVAELARTGDSPQPVWPLIVLVTDIVVWGSTFIYSGPQDTRASYPALSAISLIAPASTLFAAGSTAVAVRVMAHKCRISLFEVVQVVIAFSLAANALLDFAPQHGPLVLGLFSLMLSTGTYVCALRYLSSRKERRTFRAFGAWSAALLIAGSLWALPMQGASILLAVAAFAATYLAGRMEPTVLQVHGAAFLVVAAVIAGLPQYLYACLAATPPDHPSLGVLIVSICAAATFAVARFPTENLWQRVRHLVLSFVAICAIAALVVHGVLAGAAALIVLQVHHTAFLRTLTICAIALTIAFVGSRCSRSELIHLAYAALAFVGVKLLLDDLRHGHMEFIAASIALFAFTLMIVPRLVRLGAQRHSIAEIQTKSERAREISA